MSTDNGVQHSGVLSFWKLSIILYLINTISRKLDLFLSSGERLGATYAVEFIKIH
jgi:hypothetical protein